MPALLVPMRSRRCFKLPDSNYSAAPHLGVYAYLAHLGILLEYQSMLRMHRMDEPGALLNSYALGLSLLLGINLNSYTRQMWNFSVDSNGFVSALRGEL